MRSFVFTPVVVLLAGCSLLSEDDLVRRFDMDGDGHDALHFGGDDCDDDAAASFGDDDGDGYSACGADQRDPDCDDQNADVSPGTVEVACNGVDDDCNGFLDLDDDGADTTAFIWYLDVDGDGYGAGEATQPSCEPPTTDFVNNNHDCDDGDDKVNPDTVWYFDDDRDGKGRDDDTKVGCEQPLSYVLVGGDCDDANVVIPADEDVLDVNLTDENCDGKLLPEEVDDDGDGFTEIADGDCDDTDPDTYVGAPDVPYDGNNNACHLMGDNDQDDDGFLAESEGGDDCDDSDDTKRPPTEQEIADANGAYDASTGELWYDDIDSDCDGNLDDRDGDGQAGNGKGNALPPFDCDDLDPRLRHDGTVVFASGWTFDDLDHMVSIDCRRVTYQFPAGTSVVSGGELQTPERGTRFVGAGVALTRLEGLRFNVVDGPERGVTFSDLTLAKNTLAPAIAVGVDTSVTIDSVALVENTQAGTKAPALDVSGDVTATDLIVDGNTAPNGGAAIVKGTGTLTVTGGSLSANVANAFACEAGGAVALSGMDLVDNVRGVMFADGCEVAIDDAQMTGNGTVANAWFVATGASTNLEIRDSWLVGAGGRYGVIAGPIDLTLERSVVANAVTQQGCIAPSGGAHLLVRNVVFANNVASAGPASISALALSSGGSVSVENAVFVDQHGYSSSASGAGAANFTFPGTPILGGLAAFSVLTGSSPTPEFQGLGSATFILADPKFVSYSPTSDWHTWDLHLQATSPLIDAGLGASGTDIGLYP